ncbi:hypothetical protein MMC30_005665 [Trapelia coarctata]|nr:hypothetical protein [Trapelia coarctata]
MNDQRAFSGQWQGLDERLVPCAKKRKWPFGTEHQELPRASQLQEPLVSQKPEIQKRPRWKQTTDSFLKTIPRPSAWRQKQVEVGLNGVNDYEKVIQAFIGNSNVGNDRKPISDFKAFLLLSLCEVLTKRGTSPKIVDQMTQSVTNASKDQRLRLRRSALWVNSLINELVKRGWNIYRATELFFINALSLSSLGFIRNGESLRLILKHLGTDKFVKHDFRDCLEPHYTVPGLVASLASSSAKKLSMDDTCAVLGYDPNFVPKSMECVYTVHAASDTSIALTLHVLTTGSFQSKDVSPASVPCSSSALNTADPRCSFNQESTQRKVSPSHVSQESSTCSPQDQDETSFLRVEHESKDAATLLKLLCFTDGADVSEFVLIRAREPQKVWGSSGEVQVVAVTETGLENDVLSLVSSDLKIDKAIRSLEAFMLIRSEPGPYGCRNLSLDRTTQLHLVQCIPDPVTWRLQALILMCHTFPMHQYLQPLYGNLGRLQIHQIQHIVEQYHLLDKILSPSTKHKFAEVLLAASYFGDVPWKSRAGEAVKMMIVGEVADYLQTWLNMRVCILTGLDCGGETMEPVIYPENDQIDARSNAFYGQWILSYAANKIRRNNLIHARIWLSRFLPLNRECPSTMERLVLQRKKIMEGKIFRYQGKFREAQERLTPSLGCENAALDGATASTRIPHLAAVLCELGEPEKAQEILESEIQLSEALNTHNLRQGKGLRLALAEALLEQRLCKKAEDIYLTLEELFKNTPNTNMDTQMCNMRIRVGLARISHLNNHWSNALCYWENALAYWEGVVQTSMEWENDEGFIKMIIYYSIGDVKFELGMSDYESYLKKGDKLLERNGRRFWFTALGTSWLKFIWYRRGRSTNFLLECGVEEQ